MGTRFIILLKITEICRMVRGNKADYKCITRPGAYIKIRIEKTVKVLKLGWYRVIAIYFDCSFAPMRIMRGRTGHFCFPRSNINIKQKRSI